MFFKRLEIYGFKSFANKTVVEFTPGATIIVGPNGCGKSNVLDSIRWVLGEQRARAMRGQRMGDVIFNGSASMKAMNLARVNIIIDNEARRLDVDHSEIQIGRQLMRSGDSSYQINRMNCRMKSIQELLMDTGAGVNAYSILEQGRVDQIITAKPQERRIIFEEAAGISRYRQRKVETLRKLERTESDLARLADIIREVKGQSISLKRQANRALRYKALDAELTQLEMALIDVSYVRETGRRAEYEESLEKVSQHLEELVGQIEVIEASVEVEREAAEALDREARALQNQLNSEREFISQCERAVALYEERRGAYDRQARQLAEEVEQSTTHARRVEEQAEETQAQASQMAEEVEQLESVRNERLERQQILRRDQERKRGELREKQRELDQARESWRRRENEIKLANSRCETIESQIRQAHEQCATQRERREQLTQSQEEKKSRIQGLEQVIAQRKAALEKEIKVRAEGEETLGLMLTDLESTIQVYSESHSRLEALKELEERFEGYGPGVKAVMQAGEAGALHGIRGVLPHLIRSKAEYETAIEMALGSSIEDIVTDTADQAATAVEFLRKNEMGRGRFLPLDSIYAPPLDERFRALPERAGVIGVAADLVECEDWLRPVVQATLGATILVEDIDVALGLGREGYHTRYVTLNGEVVSSKGAITGGDILPATLLGREREIDELTERVDSLSKTERSLREEIYSHRESLRIGGETLNELREEVHHHDVDLARARNEAEQIQQALGDIARRLEEYEEAVEELAEELEKTQQHITRVREEAQDAEKKAQDLEVKIEDHQTETEALDEALAQASEELNQTSVSLTSARERYAALRDRAAALQSESERATRTAEQKASQIETLKEQIAVTEREEASAIEKLDQMRQKREATEKHAAERNEERERHMSVMSDMRQKLQSLSRERDQTQNRVHDADLKLQQANLKIDQLNEQAREKFRLTAEEVSAEVTQIRERIAERQKQAEENTPSEDSPQTDAPQDTEAEKTDEAKTPDNEDGEPQESDEELLFDIPENPSELKARITPLREQIARLGPINTVAIEEYDQLRERYTFLQTQEKDMIEARDSMLQAIKTIDKTSRELFVEAFNIINTNFQEMFRRLFNGGKAFLKLSEDAEDVLDAGVEIIAQPPGKQLGNLSMMSGGEKALTAIALLFGIFQFKPSPFCVLDEIDAPLDDANCQRLVEMLSEFSKTVQFIIITHNKITMQLADTIYGVTMDEPGVSRLLSIPRHLLKDPDRLNEDAKEYEAAATPEGARN